MADFSISARALPPTLRVELLEVGPATQDIVLPRWPAAFRHPPEDALPPDEGALIVQLDDFAGPLDLLLDLVRRHRFDLLTVPLARILLNFAEYVETHLGRLDVCGDFAAFAGRLLHLKATLVVPYSQALPEEMAESGQDPRPALVARLLELQRFRQAAENLGQRPLLGVDTFARSEAEIPAEEDGPGPLSPADITQLLQAFQAVNQRLALKIVHTVTLDDVPVEAAMAGIAKALRKTGRFLFTDLCAEARTRGELIAALLAILELARLKMVALYQDKPRTDIIVEAQVHPDRIAELAAGAEDNKKPLPQSGKTLASRSRRPKVAAPKLPFPGTASDTSVRGRSSRAVVAS